jgi:predicted PurR-regulated permease PerM
MTLERRRPRENPDESSPGAGHGRIEPFPYAMTITLVVGLVVFLYFVREILLPFAIAGIVAFVVTPLLDNLARRTRLPRALYAVGFLLALLAFGALLGSLGAPPLVAELTHVSENLQGTVAAFTRELIGNRTLDLMGQPLDAARIGALVAQGVASWLGQGNRILWVVAFGAAGFLGLILSIVLLGYFLLDAHRIGRGLLWLIPPRHRPLLHHVGRELEPVLRRYFVGVALVVLYASTAAYIGLGVFLKLKHALFLALLTGVLELIPVVGPASSAVIAGLVAVQQATTPWDVLAYILYATALRISIDQFFGPLVLGRAAYVPPVLVIFCFLAGAVPVALSVKALLRVIYRESAEGG